MNAIGYARVSTDEQAREGYSMAAQERAIEDYCQRQGWKLVKVFADAGKTGRTTTGRDGLAEAREFLRAGDAKVMVAIEVSRLARSMADFAVMAQEAQTHEWDIAIINMGLDSTTAYGKLALNLMASFAEFESELISARTKAGMAEAKRAGTHVGRPKEIDPKLVKRIGDLRDDGLSWYAIERLLDEEGVKGPRGGKLDRGSLHKLMVGRA